MTQTCHTGGTWGRVVSLPPGSLFFPARGGAQSEPGGWSDSKHHSCHIFLGKERNLICLLGEDARSGSETAFTADWIPLAQITSFKYIGRIITAVDDEWPAVVRNLRKERRKLLQLTRMLSREGVDAWTSVHIFLALFQSLMLYGLEMWVMTSRIWRVLGGFHHRVACRLTGRQPQRGRDGVCTYPPMEDPMVEARLQEIDTYLSRFHNTVTQFIVTRPIMDLSLEAYQTPGTRVSRWW